MTVKLVELTPKEELEIRMMMGGVPFTRLRESISGKLAEQEAKVAKAFSANPTQGADNAKVAIREAHKYANAIAVLNELADPKNRFVSAEISL